MTQPMTPSRDETVADGQDHLLRDQHIIQLQREAAQKVRHLIAQRGSEEEMDAWRLQIIEILDGVAARVASLQEEEA